MYSLLVFRVQCCCDKQIQAMFQFLSQRVQFETFNNSFIDHQNRFKLLHRANFLQKSLKKKTIEKINLFNILRVPLL